MKIKSYKKCGTNQYELTLDNNKKIKLYDDVILKYELLISSEIKDKELDKITKENNLLESYYKGLKYISLKMKTKYEIRDYLKSKGYSSSEINYALDRLIKDGYINEESYIEAYVNDSINLSLIGPNKIYNNLKNKGLSDKLIYDKLDSISDKVWIDRINKIIEKKLKTNKYSEYIFKNKMYAYLINNGYSSELINKVLNKVTIDNSNVFDKEADKIWNSLSNKYEDKELKYKFKNKMYSKGYSISLINEYIDKK